MSEGSMSNEEQTQAGPPSREPEAYVVTQDIDATNAWELKPLLLQHLYAHGPRLVVDLRNVQFIDSTGLGMLVSVLREAREQGGGVTLLYANREVGRLLQITGLERLFEDA
jgi:anti-sigma B factor antagonist